MWHGEILLAFYGNLATTGLAKSSPAHKLSQNANNPFEKIINRLSAKHDLTVFNDDSGFETSANPDAGQTEPGSDLILGKGKLEFKKNFDSHELENDAPPC